MTQAVTPSPAHSLTSPPSIPSKASRAAQHVLQASPRSLRASLLNQARTIVSEPLQRISILVLIASIEDDDVAKITLEEATTIAKTMEHPEEAFVKIAGGWGSLGYLENGRGIALDMQGLHQALAILEMIIFATNGDAVSLKGLLKVMATIEGETDSQYVHKKVQALLKIARMQTPSDARETICQIKEEASKTPDLHSYLVVEILTEVAKLEASLKDIDAAKETLEEAENKNTTYGAQAYGALLIAKARAKIDLPTAKKAAFHFQDSSYVCEILIACAQEEDGEAARLTLEQAKESLPTATPRKILARVQSCLAMAKLANAEEAKALLTQAKESKHHTVETLVEILKVEKNIDPEAAETTLKRAIELAEKNALSLALIATAIDKTLAARE